MPDIEDATLRACLAPLMEAMTAGVEIGSLEPLPEVVTRAQSPTGSLPRGSLLAGSNDNPRPFPEAGAPRERAHAGTPSTLAEWRLLADDDFGVFRMIERFLTMTEAELLTAATDFPKQIDGTVARMARIRRRLATQYDRVTIAVALLERAMARAAEDRSPR